MDLGIKFQYPPEGSFHCGCTQHEARHDLDHRGQKRPVFVFDEIIEDVSRCNAHAEIGDLFADHPLACHLGTHGVSDSPPVEVSPGHGQQFIQPILDHRAGIARADHLAHAEVVGAVHAGNGPPGSPRMLKVCDKVL